MSAVETLTLTDFLLARIAEDEAGATVTVPCPDAYPNCAVLHQRVDRRMLAECDTKRRIVELHVGSLVEYHRYVNSAGDDAWYQCSVCEDGPGRHEGDIEHQPMPCPTLRILTLPYADHPAYREEWRP